MSQSKNLRPRNTLRTTPISDLMNQVINGQKFQDKEEIISSINEQFKQTPANQEFEKRIANVHYEYRDSIANTRTLNSSSKVLDKLKTPDEKTVNNIIKTYDVKECKGESTTLDRKVQFLRRKFQQLKVDAQNKDKAFVKQRNEVAEIEKERNDERKEFYKLQKKEYLKWKSDITNQYQELVSQRNKLPKEKRGVKPDLYLMLENGIKELTDENVKKCYELRLKKDELSTQSVRLAHSPNAIRLMFEELINKLYTSITNYHAEVVMDEIQNNPNKINAMMCMNRQVELESFRYDPNLGPFLKYALNSDVMHSLEDEEKYSQLLSQYTSEQFQESAKLLSQDIKKYYQKLSDNKDKNNLFSDEVINRVGEVLSIMIVKLSHAINTVLKSNNSLNTIKLDVLVSVFKPLFLFSGGDFESFQEQFLR